VCIGAWGSNLVRCAAWIHRLVLALVPSLDECVNTCCDHMASDEGFMFCDINREFPFECRCCAAWGKDADPTPERARIWRLKVAGPAEAQAEAVNAEPGRG
jgi:hypothetical protein